LQEREASTSSATQQAQEPQQQQQPERPAVQQDFTTAAAKFVAEAVASPIFYLVAGMDCTGNIMRKDVRGMQHIMACLFFRSNAVQPGGTASN
jgi:hypothetical protein